MWGARRRALDGGGRVRDLACAMGGKGMAMAIAGALFRTTPGAAAAGGHGGRRRAPSEPPPDRARGEQHAGESEGEHEPRAQAPSRALGSRTLGRVCTNLNLFDAKSKCHALVSSRRDPKLAALETAEGGDGSIGRLVAAGDGGGILSRATPCDQRRPFKGRHPNPIPLGRDRPDMNRRLAQPNSPQFSLW